MVDLSKQTRYKLIEWTKCVNQISLVDEFQPINIIIITDIDIKETGNRSSLWLKLQKKNDIFGSFDKLVQSEEKDEEQDDDVMHLFDIINH